MICCLCGTKVSSRVHRQVVDWQMMDELWLAWMTKQLDNYSQALEYRDACVQLIICRPCWKYKDWEEKSRDLYDAVSAIEGGDRLA